jgi:hypothetical protein
MCCDPGFTFRRGTLGGYFARKILIQILNYLTFCKVFIAKELRAIRDAGRSRTARTFLYLIACLLCLSPSGRVGINHLGNLALKIINRIRPRESSA